MQARDLRPEQPARAPLRRLARLVRGDCWRGRIQAWAQPRLTVVVLNEADNLAPDLRADGVTAH